MKLIQEVNDSLSTVIEESLGKGKQLYVEGIFLQSNIKNRNGRMYPEAVMDKEVQRYIKEKVEKNSAFGELGHPDSPTINLDRISHLITSLRKEGTNWIGKAKILDTPMGQIAKGIIEGGGRIGTSSRALGSLKVNNEGINVVQNDFQLMTAGDLVSDPSAPEAWLSGLMENAEWIYQNGRFEMIADQSKQIIKSASLHSLEEAKIIAFHRFLQNVK